MGASLLAMAVGQGITALNWTIAIASKLASTGGKRCFNTKVLMLINPRQTLSLRRASTTVVEDLNGLQRRRSLDSRAVTHGKQRRCHTPFKEEWLTT